MPSGMYRGKGLQMHAVPRKLKQEDHESEGCLSGLHKETLSHKKKEQKNN